MDIQQDETAPRSRAALTIIFQSWSTPIVGIVMLVIGLVGGYFARPLITSSSPEGAAASPAGSASLPGDLAGQQDQTSSNQDLMAFVVSQTRHFKGEPNAPVTIIEFSDYQ